MELRSEIRLFQESREYLGEMQQQFGHVMQEDYGASLGIQELEGLLNRERAQFQSNATLCAQETRQEFAEPRDRADMIRLEASEAIAARDSQQSHERELISDEAMKLKRINDLLVSELNFAQNDAIQASHMMYSEQKALDSHRKKITEEEVAIRNLSGEMTVMQSYINLENAKNERLQLRIDEDRQRYEQRLSLVISNPEARDPNAIAVDVASRVEIQRLKRELSVAENTLAIVPNNSAEMIASNAEMMKELNEMKMENEEMKKHGSFEFRRQKYSEANDERARAERRCMKLERTSDNQAKCLKKKREKPVGTVRTQIG